MSDTSLRALVGQPGLKRHSLQEPKFQEEAEYQAYSFGRVGRKPEIMLEFRKADGYRLSIQYIDLKEIETSNPSKGFVIVASKRKIIIEGANLDRCYRYLQQNRIAELTEVDRSKALGAEPHEAIIASLRIQQNDSQVKARH